MTMRRMHDRPPRRAVTHARMPATRAVCRWRHAVPDTTCSTAVAAAFVMEVLRAGGAEGGMAMALQCGLSLLDTVTQPLNRPRCPLCAEGAVGRADLEVAPQQIAHNGNIADALARHVVDLRG